MPSALLLVDDDDDMRTSLRHFLSDEGFHVHTAQNGLDALNKLAVIEPPCLILLDLMMPVMDGNEFLAERSGSDKLARIPVVVMSAWTHDWKGAELGVAAVLNKPVKPEHLLDLVARYCNRDGTGDPRRR